MHLWHSAECTHTDHFNRRKCDPIIGYADRGQICTAVKCFLINILHIFEGAYFYKRCASLKCIFSNFRHTVRNGYIGDLCVSSQCPFCDRRYIIRYAVDLHLRWDAHGSDLLIQHACVGNCFASGAYKILAARFAVY